MGPPPQGLRYTLLEPPPTAPVRRGVRVAHGGDDLELLFVGYQLAAELDDGVARTGGRLPAEEGGFLELEVGGGCASSEAPRGRKSKW
jgi:hypothetical protein